MASRLETDSIYHTYHSIYDSCSKEQLAMALAIQSHFVLRCSLDQEFEEYLTDVNASVRLGIFDREDPDFLKRGEDDL